MGIVNIKELEKELLELNDYFNKKKINPIERQIICSQTISFLESEAAKTYLEKNHE